MDFDKTSKYHHSLTSAKFYGLGALYCLIDFLYNHAHYSKRNIYPLPSFYLLLSHCTLLGILLIGTIASHNYSTPKISAVSYGASFGLAITLRYDVFDLNHNYGAPGYKAITVILIPLAMLGLKASRSMCGGVFTAMLISSSIGQRSLIAGEFVFGVFLVGMFYMFVRLSSLHYSDQRAKGSRLKHSVQVAIEILLGLVATDLLMMCFEKETAERYPIGLLGGFLFAALTLAKLFAVFSCQDCGLSYIMAAWIIKTLLFSMTYTLSYKFDLLISNFLAVLFWLAFVICRKACEVMGFQPIRRQDQPLFIHED